jgi:hypothetical protein
MERLYYVQRENEIAETSNRFEAVRIASEWARRGYRVSAIAVDVTDKSVQLADGWNGLDSPATGGESSLAGRSGRPPSLLEPGPRG